MRVAFGLVLLLGIAARGAAPATAPTTAASQPARLEPLVGGALRYEAPREPWKLTDPPQDRFVRYVTQDSHGYLEIAIDDFAGLNETQKQSYIFRLGKALKEQAQK